MPVPKRKTSKARRDQRQSCKFIRPAAFSACKNCESPIGGHQVCADCGFYKGRKVIMTKLERAVKRAEERKEAAKHASEAQASEASTERA